MELKPFTGDYREHTAGQLYDAYIRSYEAKEGDHGTYILWRLSGDEIADDTALVSSAALSKKSKLGGWVQLIYPGYDFADTFDADTLIGKSIKVMFAHSEVEGGGWNEKGNIVAKGTQEDKDWGPGLDSAPF